MNLFKICGVLSAASLASTPAYAGMIKNLQFMPSKGTPSLLLTYEGDASFNVVEDKKNYQIILEIKGATLPASLTRVVDLSMSTTPVIQITPYNVGDKNAGSKIVMQLTRNIGFSAKGSAGRYELSLVGPVQDADAAVKLPPLQKREVKVKKIAKLGNSNWQETDEVPSTAAATVKEDENTKRARDLVDTLNAVEEDKVYKGEKISLEAPDIDILDVLRLISDKSHLNIITKDVKIKLSISLRDIPWDQLLDIILQQNQLKASVVGNVIRITTIDNYTKEQESKKKSLTLERVMEPVIMAVLPLSYAKADEMKKMIEQLVVREDGSSPSAASAPSASSPAPAAAKSKSADELREFEQAFVKGKIEVDGRSNSLIVTNTSAIIKRIKRLVKELDVPLPQVLIESKIVIANETFSKSLGVSWGGRLTPGSGRAGVGLAFNGGATNVNNPAGTEVPVFPITSTAGSASNAGNGVLGVSLGAGRAANLTAQLSIAELDGVGKTVASPRIIVNNKQAATVTDGTKIATTGTTSTGGSAQTTTQYTDAVLSLTVTPQITSAGSVLMDLSISKDAPEGGNISTKSIKTQVMVDSGSTLVLGGVYQYVASKFRTGIPVLKDLPFLGSLFGMSNENFSKTELMVFITPKIIAVDGGEEIKEE